MSQFDFVIVAGSPSASSRSARLLHYLVEQLAVQGLSATIYSLADFDAEDLLRGNGDNPKTAAFIHTVRSARGLIVATPVYKGTFSGVLKLILDQIPPDALKGRLALALVTARIAGHLPEAARGLRGIFEFFTVRKVLPALTFTDTDLFEDTATSQRDAAPLSSHVTRSLSQAATQLAAALTSQPARSELATGLTSEPATAWTSEPATAWTSEPAPLPVDVG